MKHDGGVKHASCLQHVEKDANPREYAHVRLVVEALAPCLCSREKCYHVYTECYLL